MGMTPLRMLGIVLVVLGLASLAYQGVTYTTREKIFDIGPISATTERTKQIPLPPLAGIAVAATGVLLVIVGARKRA